MKKICRSTGLEERTVHSLRHTNITMQIAAGVPIVTVKDRAGHARTSTTTANIVTSLKPPTAPPPKR